jgi:hypothetical protein
VPSVKVRALPTLHDLPPLWDGRRVEWKGWTSDASTLGWHGRPQTCEVCGHVGDRAINLGLVFPHPGETMTEPKTVRSKRVKGREYVRNVTVLARPIYWLTAFRCSSCHLDTVWDRRTDEWWDLDPSDYGDDGSTDGALPGL